MGIFLFISVSFFAATRKECPLNNIAIKILTTSQISALTSSVVDSIPVTAMMVKIVVLLAQNKALNLPVEPMVFALAYGPTLGGNGSLYGASSNIVCAGVAEKLGYKITFFQYFK